LENLVATSENPAKNSDSSCPICESASVHAERVFGPAYRECENCGFVWRIDRENFSNPNKFYDENEPAHMAELLEQEKGDARRRYYASRLDYLHRFQRPPGRLLELGCGSGGLSRAALDAGWQVQALEPSPALRANAEQLLGKDRVQAGKVETADFEENAWDAVVGLDLIEHIPDTRVLADMGRRFLRGGGVMYIQTPNAKALRRYLQGAKWNQLRPDVHYLFHTAGSIRLLFEKSGFRILYLRTVSGIPTASMMRRLATAVYGNALALFGIGNSLLLIAEKQR
jgi:SAM-dependent methyltransferase